MKPEALKLMNPLPIDIPVNYSLAAGIFLILLTRLIPRLFFSGVVNPVNDFWNFLLTSRAIRKNRHRVPERIDNFLFPDYLDYPPLLPWLFSFIPDRGINWAERSYPAVVDTLYLVAIWFFFTAQVPDLGLPLPAGEIMLVMIVLPLYPLFFMLGKGPRTFITTPRSFSEVLILVYVFSLAGWLYAREPRFILIALAAALIQTITNRFGMQVFLLISLGLAAVYQDLVVLIMVGVVPLAAFIVWGRTWGRVLGGSIGHALFMRRVWYNPRRAGNKLGGRPGGKNWLKTIWNYFMEHKFFQACVLSPGLFLGILFIVLNPHKFESLPGLLAFSLAVMLIVLFVAVLFSSRDLLFWGTGDRYLLYSIPFQVVFLLFVLRELPQALSTLVVIVTLLMGLLAFCINLLLLNKEDRKNRALAAGELELYQHINRSPSRRRLLPIWGGRSNKLILNTDCLVPDVQYSYRPWLTSDRFILGYYAEYSFPRPDAIINLINDYGLDGIVVRKTVLEQGRNRGLKYDFQDYEVEFENQHFILYAI